MERILSYFAAFNLMCLVMSYLLVIDVFISICYRALFIYLLRLWVVGLASITYLQTGG